MENYKLSDEAQDDLVGIHQYGVRKWGEKQADKYFWQLISHLEKVGESPLLYPPVDHIRAGYRRSVCGVHSVYYRIEDETALVMAILRSQDAAARL